MNEKKPKGEHQGVILEKEPWSVILFVLIVDVKDEWNISNPNLSQKLKFTMPKSHPEGQQKPK